jgi:type I restriction enzyme S subunit
MNVHMGRFKPDDLAFIDESQAAQLNNVVLEPDDVLLNITGASVPRSCTLDNSVLPARVNQHVCILRPEPNKLDHQYLMRFLTSEQGQRELHRIASLDFHGREFV